MAMNAKIGRQIKFLEPVQLFKCSLIHRPMPFRYQSVKRNSITAFVLNSLASVIYKPADVYIFCASTGRSGTKSLASVFEKEPLIAAFHEPYPSMAGVATDLKNDGDPVLNKAEFDLVKAVYLKYQRKSRPVYLESNHMFLKAYADHVLNSLEHEKIRIVHLIRQPLEVASSIVSLGHIPGTRIADAWYLNPERSQNLIQIGRQLKRSKPQYRDAFKALWYWYETEARVAALQKDYPLVKFHHLTTEQLNDPSKLTKMCDNLGLTPYLKQVETTQVPPQISNRKRTLKQSLPELDQNLNTQFLNQMAEHTEIDLHGLYQQYVQLSQGHN